MDTHKIGDNRDFQVRTIRNLTISGLEEQKAVADPGVTGQSRGWRLKTSAERVQEIHRDLGHLNQELERLKQVTSISQFSF